MDIKINEIMDIMDNIQYGFMDENNENIIDKDIEKWNNEFNSFYYLQTPDELLKSKCGVCWDQVELERKLFNDVNVPFKCYFIYISDENKLPSHTFLTFIMNNKYYWFEHSWYKYKGIHEYSSLDDLLLDVIKKFKGDNSKISNDSNIYLYQYERPKEHISCDEFYKYIETQELIQVGSLD